jgi:L-lactate dehydrogenase complex protein LldG
MGVELTENSGRDRILGRIRTALATPAEMHHGQGGAPFLPVADPLTRFQKECAGNNTECVIAPNLEASAAAIAKVLGEIPSGEIYVQDAQQLRRMAAGWSGSGRKIRWSNDPAEEGARTRGPNECSEATITLAEGLVALTGSVFVSSACGGRGAAVVAPLHIVVATAEQIFPDLESAFAELRRRGTAMANSYLCLITGSSRTADIEKILVMGAHGPRRLLVTVAMSAE